MVQKVDSRIAYIHPLTREPVTFDDIVEMERKRAENDRKMKKMIRSWRKHGKKHIRTRDNK